MKNVYLNSTYSLVQGEDGFESGIVGWYPDNYQIRITDKKVSRIRKDRTDRNILRSKPMVFSSNSRHPPNHLVIRDDLTVIYVGYKAPIVEDAELVSLYVKVAEQTYRDGIGKFLYENRKFLASAPLEDVENFLTVIDL